MTRRLGHGHAQRVGMLGVVVVALVLVLALLLAACGGDEGTTSSASPSASGSAAAATWTTADLAAIQADPALKAMLPSSIQSSGVIKCLSDIRAALEYFDPADSTNPARLTSMCPRRWARRSASRSTSSTSRSIRSCCRSRAATATVHVGDVRQRRRQAAGFSFVDYSFDGTGMIVVKGNPKGSRTSTAWSARRSPVRMARPSRRS